MSDLIKKFGERLRAVRKEKGISQDALSRLSDIDRSYIGRMDRGEVNITLDKLYSLAKALDCQPSELLPEMDYSDKNKNS